MQFVNISVGVHVYNYVVIFEKRVYLEQSTILLLMHHLKMVTISYNMKFSVQIGLSKLRKLQWLEAIKCSYKIEMSFLISCTKKLIPKWKWPIFLELHTYTHTCIDACTKFHIHVFQVVDGLSADNDTYRYIVPAIQSLLGEAGSCNASHSVRTGVFSLIFSLPGTLVSTLYVNYCRCWSLSTNAYQENSKPINFSDKF